MLEKIIFYFIFYLGLLLAWVFIFLGDIPAILLFGSQDRPDWFYPTQHVIAIVVLALIIFFTVRHFRKKQNVINTK